MRYAELSCTEFYSCYLQQCHSIGLLSYRTPGHGQNGHINKVCPSLCSEVSLELTLQFFLELHVVLGTHVMLCITARFFENRVLPPKWRKQTQGFLKKFSFFSQFFIFFINLVYNKSLYYCSSCMLEEISYLGKSWFLIYAPKCSWPIRLRNFSINCRSVIYAVSHKEINEITCFFVVSVQQFSQEWLIRFF